MALNKAAVGREYPPVESRVNLDALQKYARAYNDDNPAYFDPKRPGGVIAPPMFAVAVTWQSVMQPIGDPDLHVDLLRLVHGEQDMEFIAPIRPADVLTSTSKIVSIESKSTSETMTLEILAHRGAELVQRTLFSVFIRGAGTRGASQSRPPEPERGAPLYTVAQKIDDDQTYRYAEASGDHNPIHVNPDVAKMAGLPGIIVHGLCTMAFTSKAAIDKLCGGDPARLKRLRVRFSRPVLPGQTITTRFWASGGRAGRHMCAFETCNPDGQAVIRGGIAEVAA